MRSPADAARRRFRSEGALRGVAFAALLSALTIAWWLARRSADGAPIAVAVRVEGTLAPVARDSLAALARAGRAVSWSGDVAPIAAMVEPVREPGDRWRLSVVSDAAVSVRDSLGAIDSLGVESRGESRGDDSIGAKGGMLTTSAARGALLVSSRATEARVVPRDTVALGRVAVYARAGWEPRFAITALEEAGWRVDARLSLGRDRNVRQGELALRRSRHSLAIVFDTASLRREATALVRFVREGGGVILAGEAASATPPVLRSIAGARVVSLEPPETRSFVGHEPTHALPLYALGSLRSDAVIVEDREGTPAVVARRVGAGRLVQLGYAESWRWRMEGEGRAVEEHRTYWSQLAGLAAAGSFGTRELESSGAPDVRGELMDASQVVQPAHSAHALDGAPLATLVHALGPQSTGAPDAPTRGPALPLWLGPLILLALLAEWASRRGRGAA